MYRPSHVALAAVMVALGIQGLITHTFTPVWQPIPRGVPGREALVYFSAIVSLTCDLGMLVKRTAATAASILFASLSMWWLVFRVGDIVRGPNDFGAWDGTAETAVMVAGTWVLFVRLAGDWDKRRIAFVGGDNGLRVARVLYGLALIPFGLAHLLYVKQTAVLVPSWLPAHVFWVYATATAFLAAGLAVLINVWARLAAALSALQIGLFTLLVWVPIVAAGTKDAYQWSEFGISTALTAAAWVVADSYRDIRTG